MPAATIHALGAIIGYLGAEVVEAGVFKRLLWPERFYNYLDANTLFKLMVFGSTSGPLHRAALETLDRFRDKGLYKGHNLGDMIGTAFLEDKAMIGYYRRQTSADRGPRKEVRNGFWVEVLSHVDVSRAKREAMGHYTLGSEDSHSGVDMRAMRPIFQLDLKVCNKTDSDGGCVIVSEQRITRATMIGVIISEISSILFAVAAAVWHRFGHVKNRPPSWYIAFVLFPLALKFISLFIKVRREGLIPIGEKAKIQGPVPAEETSTPIERMEIFEVEYPTLGFILISISGEMPTNPGGKEDPAFQFFRHYGHPVRKFHADRAREIACMALIYGIGLYFPAGLILISWMNDATQYLWLSQQAYTVLVAHLLRLAGLQAYGRTEERIAKKLASGEIIYLSDDNGAVKAELKTEVVSSVKEGRIRVRQILENKTQSPDALASGPGN